MTYLNIAFIVKTMKALNEAIKIIGTQAKLAELLKVTPMAVTQWKKRRIPDWAVIPIEAATDGAVTRHELRPDIYPESA